MPRSRKVSKDSIIQYDELKAAAGGSGSGGGGRGSGTGSGFHSGRNEVCRILKSVPGGYEVEIFKGNMPGFIETQADLKSGQELLAQFVCVYRQRIMLAWDSPS